MKKLVVSLCVILLVLGVAGSASATAIIDPSAGGDYYFWWDGFDQIDGISQLPSGPDLGDNWGITVGMDSYLTLMTAWDDFIPGDVFALYVDGTPTPWTGTYWDSSGYFHGIYDDLFLSSGTHSLTLYVTAGLDYGGAYATFSGTEPIAPVPEPATMLLLGSGLIGLAGCRRKVRKR